MKWFNCILAEISLCIAPSGCGVWYEKTALIQLPGAETDRGMI